MNILKRSQNIIFLVVFLVSSIAMAADNLYVSAKKDFDSKQYQNAAQKFSKYLLENPDHKNAILMLGLSLQRANNNNGAIKAYERFLAIDKNDRRIYTNLARAYYNEGDISKTIETANAGLAIDRNNFRLQNILGLAYFDQGKDTEAEKAYRASISINEKSPWTHNNLGLLLLNRGETSEARKEFTIATQTGSKVSFFYNNLGVACERLKKYDQAAIAFSEALKINPDNRKATLSLERVKKAMAK